MQEEADRFHKNGHQKAAWQTGSANPGAEQFAKALQVLKWLPAKTDFLKSGCGFPHLDNRAMVSKDNPYLSLRILKCVCLAAFL